MNKQYTITVNNEGAGNTTIPVSLEYKVAYEVLLEYLSTLMMPKDYNFNSATPSERKEWQEARGHVQFRSQELAKNIVNRIKDIRKADNG